ncbi:DUF2497 domain-containing protein [Novosphingobium sp. JCM 18896]|uniref:DUF2497 domain-containing protein n=1 Tax=Novosphingobium sp. JCM 18896 TaxID=2989731 RepID=UPI002223E074|nr:DUF2497 domain-containing protein [Novosphingobium sp. JCM 18896]MCW1429251.1 DUF2497 domain-containing protein [Novosphingobium sp. JCM 18896]
MRNAGEPTVEEILESIKKVIARDNRAGAVETRRQRETHGVAETAFPQTVAEPEDDVLDLAEEGQFAPADLAQDDEEDEVQDAPLLTEDARVSMQDSLAALAMLAQPGTPPQIVRSGETSLEGMVRDLLRPELAKWLDKNLPPMVERMVATEIARIVGKKG